MPDEIYDKIVNLCEQEKRKKSQMAVLLIEGGLQLAGNRNTQGTLIDKLKILEVKYPNV